MKLLFVHKIYFIVRKYSEDQYQHLLDEMETMLTRIDFECQKVDEIKGELGP